MLSELNKILDYVRNLQDDKARNELSKLIKDDI